MSIACLGDIVFFNRRSVDGSIYVGNVWLWLCHGGTQRVPILLWGFCLVEGWSGRECGVVAQADEIVCLQHPKRQLAHFWVDRTTKILGTTSSKGSAPKKLTRL